MVESIYGGKVFPHCHNRSLLHRRFSTGILSPPNSLHPITEVNDDTSNEQLCESNNRRLLYVESSVPQHAAFMPNRTNRPRAFSLPVIYRDGSYLRIKLPDGSFPGGAPSNRRFSEPEIVSQPASRSRSAFFSANCASESRSRSSPPSFEEDEEITREYRSARSQSDPTAANIIGQVRKQHLAEAEVILANGVGELVNRKNPRRESWYSQNTSVAKSEIACTRRKCSLPRVLLSVDDHRGAKCDTSARRRQSFPPSKTELYNRMQQKFPEISSLSERKATTLSKSEFFSADDWSDKEQSSNIEILTRWMKFFG